MTTSKAQTISDAVSAGYRSTIGRGPTNQARALIGALKAAGIARGDFRVRTACVRGEYGEASASLFTPEAHATAKAHADDLAAAGLHVVVYGGGRFVTVGTRADGNGSVRVL